MLVVHVAVQLHYRIAADSCIQLAPPGLYHYRHLTKPYNKLDPAITRWEAVDQTVPYRHLVTA